MKQELQNQINVMAATLRPQISITQGEGGIAADAYVKTLPEGITIETVQKLQDHNAIFFPAVTKALGEESIEAMKKDSSIESVSLSVPMVGEDRFDISFQKQYQYMDTKTKEMKDAFGGVSASLTVQAARHNRGAMGAIKNDLKAQALAAFGQD